MILILVRWCTVAKSGAERMRELRERKKQAGDKAILVMLPEKYKKRFDRLRNRLRTTAAETVCYLLNLATDEEDGEGNP